MLRAFAETLKLGSLPALKELQLEQDGSGYESGDTSFVPDIGEGFEAFAKSVARGAMAQLARIEADPPEWVGLTGKFGLPDPAKFTTASTLSSGIKLQPT